MIEEREMTERELDRFIKTAKAKKNHHSKENRYVPDLSHCPPWVRISDGYIPAKNNENDTGKTGELEIAVEGYKHFGEVDCNIILCSNCPFSDDTSIKCSDEKRLYEILKAELERRKSNGNN